MYQIHINAWAKCVLEKTSRSCMEEPADGPLPSFFLYHPSLVRRNPFHKQLRLPASHWNRSSFGPNNGLSVQLECTHLAASKLLHGPHNRALHSEAPQKTPTGFSTMKLSGGVHRDCNSAYPTNSMASNQAVPPLGHAGTMEKSHWYVIPSKTVVAVTAPRWALLRRGGYKLAFRSPALAAFVFQVLKLKALGFLAKSGQGLGEMKAVAFARPWERTGWLHKGTP